MQDRNGAAFARTATAHTAWVLIAAAGVLSAVVPCGWRRLKLRSREIIAKITAVLEKEHRVLISGLSGEIEDVKNRLKRPAKDSEKLVEQEAYVHEVLTREQEALTRRALECRDRLNFLFAHRHVCL